MRLELRLDYFEHEKCYYIGRTVENLVSRIRSLGSEVLDYYSSEIKKKGLFIQVEKEYIGDKPSYPIIIRKRSRRDGFVMNGYWWLNPKYWITIQPKNTLEV